MTRLLVTLLQSLERWTLPSIRLFQEGRQPLIWLLAPIIGLATGAAAILFRLAIGVFQSPWLASMSENVATAARAQPWWVILLAPATGGILVGLMLQYVLVAKRAGTAADVMEARINAGRSLNLGQGMLSGLTSALSLGCGASAGREGPIVHLGASIAAAACNCFNLPNSARRTLLASGVAGAIAASFNTPIAGVLFAQEVVLGHFALTSFVPLVLASVMATILSQAWFGNAAAFVVPPYEIASYLEVPAFMLLGIVAAAVAVIFQLALHVSDWIARNIDMPLVARPAIGGLMIGAIAVGFPEVLGVGYGTTDAALKSELPIVMMLALLFAKTAATAIALASRFGGGVFSPSLYLGAMAGGAFGIIAVGIFPELGSGEGLYAMLGMGSVAAAVLGAPISTTIIVFELTGGFALSLALLLTVAIGHGLSQAILGRSFFLAQLESRGVVLHDGPHRELMKSVRVADFMDSLPESESDNLPEADREISVRTDDSLERALRVFDTSGAERIPVVSAHDRSRIVGWVSQVKAIARYNRELIAWSVEEHR